MFNKLTKSAMKRYILIFLISFSFHIVSQENSKLDSLKNNLSKFTDTLLIDALDEISWEYKYVNMDSAFAYSKKALKLSKKINFKKGIANSYNTLGSNFEYISKLDSALFYYEKSLSIKEDIKDAIGIANSLNNIGIIYDEKGDYINALETYFKALKIYENNTTSFDKVPMVLVNIGIVYKKQKEFKKVLEYYQKALKIYKENNYDVGIVITTGNIGGVLLKLKLYRESVNYSTEAKKMYSDLGYKRYVPYMNIQIANAKDSLGYYTESRSLYLESIRIFEKENNIYELADATIGLSNNYLKSNQFSKSKKEAEKVLKLAIENNFNEIKIRALQLLAKVNFKLKNYKNAYLNALEYNKVKDTIFENEKTKAILELETKYQTEKKEKELLKTRTEKAETELKLSKTRSWIFILIGGLLIAVILFFAINQRNKRKAEQQITQEKERGFKAIIDAQEQERSKIARELHDGVVQQIGSIILKSRNVFKKKEIEEDKEVKEILTRLNNSSEDLRNISHQMMPRALSELGLVAAIDDLLKGSLAYVNINYSFEHFNLKERLQEKIEITLYRITQELVNNIIKHSKATSVSVQLINSADHIIFIVEDDGIGIDHKKSKKGMGFSNIKSRLEIVNGEANFDKSPEKGTLVTIKIKK